MKSRHIGVALTCCLISSCQPSPPPNAAGSPDRLLRSFLGVGTIEAKYEVPAGHDYFHVMLLRFENGKLIKPTSSLVGSPRWGENRSISLEMLWGLRNGKARVTVAIDGGSVGQTTSSRDADDFWLKLDGGRTSGRSKGAVAEYDGYSILGYAESSVDHDGKDQMKSGFGFETALREKKYVGALAIRTSKASKDANPDADKP